MWQRESPTPRRAAGPSLTCPVTEGTPGRAQTGVSAAPGTERGAGRQNGCVAAWRGVARGPPRSVASVSFTLGVDRPPLTLAGKGSVRAARVYAPVAESEATFTLLDSSSSLFYRFS